MMVRLAEDLEPFVLDAVGTGLDAGGEADVIREAPTRPEPAMPSASNRPTREAGEADMAEAQPRPVKPDESSRKRLASGPAIELPDPTRDVGDFEGSPDRDRGGPLSETIIRDRREKGQAITSTGEGRK